MTIEQHIWGVTPEGEAVIIYTLRNERGTEVQLSNVGAGIVSVKFADRNGNIDDIVLGYRDPMSYFGDGACCGKSVGRVANRIANGRMEVEGREYSLEVNNGPNHLHGGSKGFANRLWESQVEHNRVIFSLLSEDGDQGYPCELAVQAIYDFDDDDSLEVTYLARTDGTTPVNLTNHTYWNLAGCDSGTILEHTLQLNASNVLEMNAVQIPTGKLLDVTDTVQDFRNGRKFAEGIDSEFNHIRDFRGYDHYFVVDGWRRNILGEVGSLYDAKSGRCLTVLSSQPGCMVYTGNWLSGGSPLTKSGGRFVDYAGVAIECQGYPDAVNHAEFPSVLLAADELYCQKTVFRLSVR